MNFRFILFFALLWSTIFVPKTSNARGFEGGIHFVRESVFDTLFVSVFVKDSMVRVEENDRSNGFSRTYLVNLNSEEVYAISYNKRQYLKIREGKKPAGFERISARKTGNNKEINGMICHQWRVKDTNRNTEVAYWMYEGDFEFFAKLLRLIRPTEHSLAIYSSIPEVDGCVPMLTEERTLLRKEKLKLRVVNIDRSEQPSSLFVIPPHFQPVTRAG